MPQISARTAQQPDNRSDTGRRTPRWLAPLALGLGAYAAVAAYYRWRPQPEGINGYPATYRVPPEAIRFFHDTPWYEDGHRHSERQIAPELIRIIRNAHRFVVMDVFLFNLQHADQDEPFVPTTRQIVDAFQESRAQGWFITDPINTSWGTAVSPPLRWLEEAGVEVCITNVRKLRDSNLIYSPLWRLTLGWFGTRMPPRISSPLEPGAKVTPWAVLDAINVHANHRKIAIADDGDDYITLVTSSNFEDASSFFGNTGITVRSAAIAHHYLEAEKALARASGCEIPVEIPARETDGDALVTPLLGAQIKQAIIDDLEDARPGDRLFLFAQYLSEREVIEALVRASDRGVEGVLVLDQNKMSFGRPRSGFPNQLMGPELKQRTRFEIRWANIEVEEYHNQFIVLERDDSCTIHAGSANFSRRGLSNTVLENNIRVDAPISAGVSRQVMSYVGWMCEMPRSLPYEEAARHQFLGKYWLCRIQEATGTGAF